MTDEEINNNEEEMEDVEVETLEFSLDDDGIEELITKLQNLKDKKSFNYEVDDENELQISYEESSEDEGDEDETGGEE